MSRPRPERLPRSLPLALKFRLIVWRARDHEFADVYLFSPSMSAELARNRMIFDPEDEGL